VQGRRVEILAVVMGGSRAQVNKAHKSRFSSKSSRNLHKTSSQGLSSFLNLCLIRFTFALCLVDRKPRKRGRYKFFLLYMEDTHMRGNFRFKVFLHVLSGIFLLTKRNTIDCLNFLRLDRFMLLFPTIVGFFKFDINNC